MLGQYLAVSASKEEHVGCHIVQPAPDFDKPHLKDPQLLKQMGCLFLVLLLQLGLYGPLDSPLFGWILLGSHVKIFNT